MDSGDFEKSRTRYVAIHFGSAAEWDILKGHPRFELHFVGGPDAADQIDMALMNDLCCPLKLAFVGGQDAKAEAERQGVMWINDSLTAEAELLRLWVLGNEIAAAGRHPSSEDPA